MKILLINSKHYRRGGADVVYLNTGQLLEKFGNKVIYFSQKSKNNYLNSYEDYFIDEIDYFNGSFFKKITKIFRFFYSFEAKRKITNLILSEKPDIAHIHLYRNALTPVILGVLRKYNIPIVITLHDYNLLCPHYLFLNGKNQICEKCLNGRYINCIIYKCNRNNLIFSIITYFEYKYHKLFYSFNKYYDKIITVSYFAFNKHINTFINKTKLIHLYNFIPNLDDITPTFEKGSYFLFFGRLTKEKGIITLINSWLLKDRKSSLFIVGGGELEYKIKNLIKNTNNISFLGFKEGTELETLIKNSCFSIIPSEWYENNPLSVLESYSHGKPVIGSIIGGIPELIVHGKTGYLFEMKNEQSLSEIIEEAEMMNKEEYVILSKNARKFAEKYFHPQKHYDELIKIYNDTIKQNYPNQNVGNNK